MITLNFDVNDQTLTRQDENTVAANSRLVHLCEFTFSSEWDGRGKVATFKKRDLMLSVILDDDACTIPPEILQSENKIDVFELSVCGADGNSTITSTIVRVPILAGTWDPFTEEITPTLFEQIMQKIDEIEKGEVSPELIYEAVTEYMEAHPLEPVIADDVAAYFVEHAAELKGPKGDTGATGPQGPKGDNGTTPVISAAATVDNTTGTPAVNVTKTGTDAAPEFTFAFSGLKGPKGDPGTPGESYDDTEVRADIDDVWKAQGELGAKNLLVYPYGAQSKEQYGVTFTINNDGSVSVTGTSTNAIVFDLYNNQTSKKLILPAGTYICSGNVDINLWGQIRVRDSLDNWSTVATVNLDGVSELVITDEMAEKIATQEYIIWFRIECRKNVTFDNVVYPMIRLASDTNDTWQPYAPTNYELMQKDNALAEGLAKFGKKLWQGNFTSGSIEVAGAAKYSAFIFNLNGAYALGTSTNGGGSFGIASSYNIAQVGYRVTPRTSGDNIIFSIDSTSYGGMMDGAQRAITEIYGLF